MKIYVSMEALMKKEKHCETQFIIKKMMGSKFHPALMLMFILDVLKRNSPYL